MQGPVPYLVKSIKMRNTVNDVSLGIMRIDPFNVIICICDFFNQF